MQTETIIVPYVQGLRKISSGLRTAEHYAAKWRGLPNTAKKADLLRLLEDVPAEKMGICQGARDFLHTLVKLQPAKCFKTEAELVGQDLDKAGLALISTYSDDELGATSYHARTLARWRAQAAEKGWICFRDSADRSRWRTGPADAPSEAYGVDLRPLIARFAELQALRADAHTLVREMLALKRRLSAQRNRLRSLAALAVSDEPLTFVERALKVIEAVRRGKDADLIRLAANEAEAAIAQLEGFLDGSKTGFFGVTPESGAPDTEAPQLPPTNPVSEIKLKPKGREGQQKQARPNATDAAHEADALPAETVQDHEDEEEEVLWQCSDYDDLMSDAAAGLVELGPVIELEAPKTTWIRRPRVNVPNIGEVIDNLPTVLALKQFPFSRHPNFKTDRSLAIAYGQAAASRLRLTQSEIITHTEAHDLGFAVAALLAEFTEGVRDRRAYLLALVGRMNDPVVKVDLWGSWKRLTRYAGTKS